MASHSLHSNRLQIVEEYEQLPQVQRANSDLSTKVLQDAAPRAIVSVGGAGKGLRPLPPMSGADSAAHQREVAALLNMLRKMRAEQGS